MGWTFTAVTIAWVFFRADTLPQALQFIHTIPSTQSQTFPTTKLYAIIPAVAYMASTEFKHRKSDTIRLSNFTAGFLCAIIVGFQLEINDSPESFIYFQF